MQNWQAAGLYEPSVVRFTIATIEQSQISGKVGTVTTFNMQGVDDALRQALTL